MQGSGWGEQEGMSAGRSNGFLWHPMSLILTTLPRNRHRNGAWAPEMSSPGNFHVLQTYKNSPGKGELRKPHSDSYLPICFCFPCDFWTRFKCILTLKWMGLKFPGKFIRRNCGLEEGHQTITRKSIHFSATGEQALETLVFPGTHFACWHQDSHADVVPSGHAFNTAGSVFWWGRSVVNPGWAMLCHCRGTHRWWEGFGSCRHQGKTLLFHTAKIIEWENWCLSSPNFLWYCSVSFWI